MTGLASEAAEVPDPRLEELNRNHWEILNQVVIESLEVAANYWRVKAVLENEKGENLKIKDVENFEMKTLFGRRHLVTHAQKLGMQKWDGFAGI